MTGGGREGGSVRVLVDKGRGVVDFVVDDDVAVFLGGVGCDVRVGEGWESGGGRFGHCGLRVGE